MEHDKPFAMITLDMDNLWCYQRSFGDPHWQRYDSFLPLVVPRILSFFNRVGISATIFVVGKDTQNKSHLPLFQELVNQGHEVANHSFMHLEALHGQSKEEIYLDLASSHQAIEQACGVAPCGYRGPAFGVSETTLEVLQQLDYLYDSSSFYSSLQRLARWYHRKNLRDKNTKLHQYSEVSSLYTNLIPAKISIGEGSIWEIPVSTYPKLRTPVHATYLNYLAQFSETLTLSYLRLALSAFEKSAMPLNFILHATDFLGAEDVSNLTYLPGMKRSAPQKLALLDKFMGLIQQRFIPVKMTEFTQRYRGASECIRLTAP